MRPPSQQLLPTLPSSAKTAAGASGELSSPLKGADSGGRLRMQVLAANYRLPHSPRGSESPPPHPQGTGRGRGALGAGRDRVRSGNGRGSRSQGAGSHPGWVPRALQGAQNAPAGKRTQTGPVLGPKPAGKGEDFTSLFPPPVLSLCPSTGIRIPAPGAEAAPSSPALSEVRSGTASKGMGQGRERQPGHGQLFLVLG